MDKREDEPMKEFVSRRKVLIAMASSLIGTLAAYILPKVNTSEALTDTTTTTANTIASTITDHNSYTINVGDYLKTGVSVDEAFKRANQALRAGIDMSKSSKGVNTGRAKIIIPAGRYVITDPSVFLSTPAARTLGLIIEGQGRGVTEILFQPAAKNQYLITNNDKWLMIEIRDMTFECADNSFMLSISNGGAQNYIFNRVSWGTLKYGIRLQGTNNNSEFTFNQCGISGSVDTFLWSETSDQFLNYNFFSCNFEVASGDFCRFDKGGNINIWGGSFIHTGEAGGTFFRLLGAQHAAGVMRFQCEGVRFEHRKSKSKLIECEWASGSVKFSSCDMSSQAFDYNHEQITALFSSNNTSMPIIHFEDCMILGQHQYNYLVGSYAFRPFISYNHCEILSGDNPQAFIVIKNKDDSFNYGGTPPIEFSNCRGADSTEIWDCVYNHQISNLAVMTKKTVSLKNADGKFPYQLSGTITAKLPLHAVITRITLSIPAGVSNSSALNDYTLKTGEGQTLLEQKTGVLNQGFVVDLKDLLIICDTDTKRTIQFTAGKGINQAVGGGALCLIEYLG
jgi:hypothetical protein